MPNPLSKSIMLSAVLALSACNPPPPSPPEPDGQSGPDLASYDPPPKITVDEPFTRLRPVTFTASVHAKPDYKVIGGSDPAILELSAAPVGPDGVRDAAGAVVTNKPYPAPVDGWSTVTFDPITVPAVASGGTLAVSVTYKSFRLGQYLPVDTKAKDVLFSVTCGPGSGDTPAERARSSVCAYKR